MLKNPLCVNEIYCTCDLGFGRCETPQGIKIKVAIEEAIPEFGALGGPVTGHVVAGVADVVVDCRLQVVAVLVLGVLLVLHEAFK